MFSSDHQLNPKCPSMPFFVGWSEEVIVPLTVTDYQEFIPLISAAASSKDVIESDIMLSGVLSGFNDEIDKTIKNPDKAVIANRTDEVIALKAKIAKKWK